jgi:PAS domain S-box-containing protein
MMDGDGTTEDMVREVSQLRQRVSELEALGGELRAERDRTQRYLDVAGVMFVVIGADEKVLLVNQKGCEVLGCAEQEVVGRNWFETILPESVREQTREVFASLMAGHLEAAERHENPIVTGDGEERIVAWHNTVLTDRRGDIVGVIASGEDITERRKAEQALSESEKRYRNLFEHSRDAICMTTRDGRFVEVNQSLLDLFGISREAIMGLTMADLYAESAEPRRFQKEIEEKGSVINREVKMRRQDGEIIDCLETAIVRRSSDGSIAGYEGIIRDVTDRRRAEAELGDSEERFKVLFEYAPYAYYLSDLRGTFLDGNKAAEQLLGYRREELVGKSFFQTTLLPARELPRVAALLARNALGQATGPDEFALNREDGTQVIAEISTFPVKLRGASVVLGIAHDVTSRREAEEALRAGERRYRELFENSPIALWEEDASEVKRYLDELRASGVRDCREYFGNHPEEVRKCASMVKVLDVNWATLDLYGAKSKKELLTGLDQVFTQDSYEVFKEELIAIAEGRTQFDAETSARTLGGDTKDIALRWTVAPGYEKTFSSVLVSDLDITERKRAEEEIRKLSQFQQSIIENANVWLDVLDENANVVVWNKAAEEISGFSRDEVVGHGKIWEWLYPDEEYRKEVMASAEATIKGQVGEDEETTIRRKDGEIRTISWHERNVVNEEGKPIGSVALGRDVTEQKQAQEALRESEERYRDLFEGAHDLVQSVGPDGRFQYVNRAWRETLGYSEAEVERLSMLDVLHPNSADHWREVFGRVMSGQDASSVEAEFVTKGGRAIAVEGNVTCRLLDAKPAAARGIFRDVTARKRAEEEIGYRTRQLALINKVGRAIAAILDVDLLLAQVVELIGQWFGYYAVSVFEVDPEAGDVVFRASTVEPAGRDQEGFRLKMGGGIVGWVAGSGETLVVDDVSAEPRYYSHPGLPDTRSELTVPIMLGQRVIGVLDVQSGELGAFDEDDVETFETLADALAVAIENARLYEEERRRSEELSALLDTAQALASSLELREVLEIIAQQVKALTQADGSRIYLLEPDGETLTPLVALGVEADEVMALPFRVGQGITGHVAATGIAEMVDDVKADPRSVHIPGTPEAQMCVLFAPLTIKGEVTGVMVVCRLGDRRFHDQDLHTAISMASHAATALQNAQLYQALTEQELQLRHQIEEAPDAILGVDLEGQITLFNREAERLSGHQQGDVLGRPFSQLVCPEYLEQLDQLLSSEAHSGVGQQVHELHIIDGWGDQVPLEVRVSPLEKGGRLTGWQVIGRDISERKHLEEMKSQFIATVSHDLRTPLASIMGFSETLMEGSPGPLTETQEEFLGIIFESSQRQLALVNDLLDVSKLEAGRLQLEMETVHLPELIWGVVEGIRPLADKKGVTLKMDVNDGLPRTEGDPRRLERVLSNLLSNAVKFTPEGGNVEVAAWQDDGQLKIRVSDTGVGIPPEDLPNLFQPFHRGRNVTKKAIEGTGLGLTIVKALVEAHKGTVEVESELDKGTTFRLTLPLCEPSLAETH